MVYRNFRSLLKASMRIPVGDYLVYEADEPPSRWHMENAKRLLAEYKWTKLSENSHAIIKAQLLSPPQVVEWASNVVLRKQAGKDYDWRNPDPSTWLHIPNDYDGGEYQLFGLIQKAFMQSDLQVELSYIVGDNNHMIKVHYYGKKISE